MQIMLMIFYTANILQGESPFSVSVGLLPESLAFCERFTHIYPPQYNKLCPKRVEKRKKYGAITLFHHAGAKSRYFYINLHATNKYETKHDIKGMRKEFFIVAMAVGTITATADNVSITTPTTQMVISANQGEELRYLYYGTRISEKDVETMGSVETPFYSVYPAYGLYCASEPALAVTHADGSLATQMTVQGFETYNETVSQPCVAGKGRTAKITKIKLKDTIYDFYVNVCYRTYDDADVIETWTEITNNEKKAVTLRRFDSGFLPIRKGNVWISHEWGSWSNEANVTEEPLTPGMMVIENKDGIRNSHTSRAEVMLSLDGKAKENSGDIIGVVLCYTGNYKIRIQTHDDESHQLFAGINNENSEYNLKKGETFTTPIMAITHSQEGLSGASRNFHKWGRTYQLAHGDKLRNILLNSWEGIYFDINEEGMDQMMGDIASMGGELFVMDDGWFGTKYQRNSDNAALGDWEVDSRKLPNGIASLIKDSKKHGINFGIWIEPEMTNQTSELYEKHPDWIIKSPGREAIPGRGGTQLILDMANPEVQDFAFSIVDNLMQENPEISYIKWDANMSVNNHGSQYLSMDNQSHAFIEYHRGLIKLCQRIREKYPDLVIQDCASGGGRANWGFMPYFDEFWVSDNNDALQRIYMQWGTSYFYPAIAMGSHIGASPGHQTFRLIPLKYRIDVAMSGRLGMEIQPKTLTEGEKALCRGAIEDYKKIRPIVQFGDIYRLVSPFDNLGVASLMYISEDKSQAVFYWYKLGHFMNEHLPRVKMAGLDPNKTYKITELNRIDNEPLAFEGKSFTGTFLMANGLEIPYNHNVDYHKNTSWSSRILYITEE